MEEKNKNTNNDKGNNSDNNDCPPIKIGYHQNSYKPQNLQERKK